MLSVTVVVVAIPGWPLRKFYAQQFVDDFNSVQDSRIVGRAQAETHQGQGIRADDRDRTRSRTVDASILDGNESLQRGRGSLSVGGRRDADVIAFDSNLAGEVGVHGIGAALYIEVPGIGHVAQKIGGPGLVHRLRHVGSN